MKKLLLIIMLLPVWVYGATYDITKTVGESGTPTYDYGDLATAEADWSIDLVTGDSSITYEIQGTWSSADGAVTFDGATTDATHTITVTATGDARHSGAWCNTCYIATANNATIFRIDDSYVTLDGLQIEVNSNSDYKYGILNSSETDLIIKNCIVWQSGGSSDHVIGIKIDDGVGYNNIVYDMTEAGLYAGSSGALFFNNTIVDCALAVYTSYEDVTLINNIFYGCTADLSGTPMNSSPYSDYNATSNSSITYDHCGSCGGNDVTSISNPFVDYTNDTFLVASSSSDGVEDGTDMSSYMDSEDIQGDSRPQSTNWDIGADEYVSGSPPASPDYYRRRRIINMGLSK